MNQIRVVHCVYQESLSSVFTSQVLARFPYLKTRAVQEVVAMTPVGQLVRPSLRNRIKRLQQMAQSEYDASITHLALPPTRLSRWIPGQSVFRRWTRRHANDQTILHCRNAMMASIALEATADQQIPVIYDCRGVECDEFPRNRGLDPEDRPSWPAQDQQDLETLERAERTSVEKASLVFTVSQVMTQHLVEKYDVHPAKFVTIPCCVDTTRFNVSEQDRMKTRKQLGLNDKLVISYLGSLAWYQLPDESLRVFRAIKAQLPSAHFLAITTQQAIMEAAIERADISRDDCTVMSTTPTEVPKYLAAADLGLLLRDDSIVNRVASPVKFAEYVASGTPVLLTKGIGDYSTLAKDQNLGLSIRLEDTNETIGKRIAGYFRDESSSRASIANFATQNLDWSQFSDTIFSAYQGLV